MVEKPPEFWNLDLTKLTWSGWLLILVTIVTVIGVAVLVLGLMVVLFVGHGDKGKGPIPRWMGVIALISGIAAGAVVFETGRRLLEKAGFPIMRLNKR